MRDYRDIPFGKPSQVGNYRIWRGKINTGRGKNKMSLEQINVCDIEGVWQVKIPSTVGMFAMIRDLYGKGDNVTLEALFGNMMYASIIPNGYFHQAINIIATIYAHPNLLDEDDDEHKTLVGNVRALVKGFLRWRKEYDKRMAGDEQSEQDIMNDEVVGEMLTSAAGTNVNDDEDGKTIVR